MPINLSCGLQDMYVYITETESFDDKFADAGALFWVAEELEYGDWTAGAEGDGTFSRSGLIPISEVTPKTKNPRFA